MPHPARASQSKTPSATTAQGGATPKTPKPKHRLGAGQRLEPGRPVGIDGPSDKPADKAAGGVGNDHHAGEPLRAPLHEQPAVPEPAGGEAVRLKRLPQPAARRVAEAKMGSGVETDAPRGQVLPGNGAAPELPGVEPRRRRQQRRVPGRQGSRPGTPGRNQRLDGGVCAPVKPLERLRQAQVLGPPDEVQHVAPCAAAEAVEPLRVGVHRE